MISEREIQNLKQSISTLGTELIQQAQDAHGFFTTKTRYAVSYSDQNMRQQVQERLDHAVNILAIANIMAIFEQYILEKYWPIIFADESIILHLKAYRHIRFSAIYGFTMQRAAENHQEFDNIMSSSDPIRGVSEYSQKALKLGETSAYYASEYVRRQYEKAIVRIHQI